MTVSARVALQLNEAASRRRKAMAWNRRKIFGRRLPCNWRNKIKEARYCCEVARAINAGVI